MNSQDVIPGQLQGPQGEPDPLAVEIAIPTGIVQQVVAVRWWIEEEQRAAENFLWDRAETIRRQLIKPEGLLYVLERNVALLALLLTGENRGEKP